MNETPENPPIHQTTLRDLFAGKAMASLIALLPNDLADVEMQKLGYKEGQTDRFIAKCAYDYADAMLAARQKGAE